MEERLQVKCNYDDGLIHIQGVSKSVNQGREYGFATKVRTTTETKCLRYLFRAHRLITQAGLY